MSCNRQVVKWLPELIPESGVDGFEVWFSLNMNHSTEVTGDNSNDMTGPRQQCTLKSYLVPVGF